MSVCVCVRVQLLHINNGTNNQVELAKYVISCSVIFIRHFRWHPVFSFVRQRCYEKETIDKFFENCLNLSASFKFPSKHSDNMQ